MLVVNIDCILNRGVSNIQQATPLLERFAWFTTRDYSSTASSGRQAPGDAALPYAYVALFDGQDGGLNAVGRAYRDV